MQELKSFPVAPLTVDTGSGGPLTAAPGTIVRGQMDLVELADGTPVRFPIVLVNGSKPGPRLYLGAAVHGDEVNGIAILAKVIAGIDPGKLSGSIICVPVQHPLAFYADHRFPVSQFMKSPLDQAPIDAWTVFPGDVNGNLSQIVAGKLFALIKQCSCAIDIHTPTRGGRYVPIAILPSMSLGASAERALWLAEQCATGFIVKGERGMYVSRGICCVEATAAGIPAFTFEIGEGGRLEESVTNEGARCISNALIGLGMMAGERKLPPVSHLMSDFVGLRAHRGGLLRTEVELGAVVKKGQLLATITDIWGDTVEKVIAPQDGVFVRSTTLSNLASGERASTLGVF
jgi:predicted deacylase